MRKVFLGTKIKEEGDSFEMKEKSSKLDIDIVNCRMFESVYNTIILLDLSISIKMNQRTQILCKKIT